jgi:hypothetical protein
MRNVASQNGLQMEKKENGKTEKVFFSSKKSTKLP